MSRLTFPVFSRLLLLVAFCFVHNLLSAEVFWDYPVAVSSEDSYFPLSASNQNMSIIIWQQVTKINDRQGNISISFQIGDGKQWKTKQNMLGPFAFSGDVPSISSVAINQDNIICIAVLSDLHTISIFTSQNEGDSFTETKISDKTKPLIAPRVYTTAEGKFYLFASQGEENNFLLLSSYSQNGVFWMPFSVFLPSQGLSRPFVPVLLHFKNKNLVVFQSTYISGSFVSYQLHSTISEDGGVTWSTPYMMTETKIMGQDFKTYHNQKANLLYFQDKIFITWERSYITSENAHIFFSEIDESGRFVGNIQQISTNSGNSTNPILFVHEKNIAILWFGTRRGRTGSFIYLAVQKGALWQEQGITTTTEDTSFSVPLVQEDSRHYYWIQKGRGSKQALMRLSPDTYADPPAFTAVNFTEGKRNTAEKVSVHLNFPKDASGIAGYSYTWSRNNTDEPPQKITHDTTQDTLTELALDDETLWFLKVRVVDNAGNWSVPKTLVYQRDITPPLRPTITPPPLDAEGFVLSNSFNLAWQPIAEDNDVVGFTYSLELVASGNSFSEEKIFTAFNPKKPPVGVVTSRQNLIIENCENGVWALSVSAVDEVGNMSEPAVVRLFVNKFEPYTIITKINQQTNIYGVTTLSIEGKGFLTDGAIKEIYFSENGMSPYKYEMSLEKGDYTIVSDTTIDLLRLNDFDQAKYQIVLNHEKRGRYVNKTPIPVIDYGTVKFGVFDTKYLPNLKKFASEFMVQFRLTNLFIILICALTIVGIIFAARTLALTVKDSMLIRQEVLALLTGENMSAELEKKQEEVIKLRHRGLSLKYKLMFFTSILVIMIVLSISIPLGMMMIKSQEATLVKGLQDRVSVLLDGLASGVRAYLPSQNILELGFLPQQSQAIKEASSVTITGFNAAGTNINLNYIWATNDTTINERIDTATLVYGESRLNDEVSKQISETCLVLNEQAVEAAGSIASEIDKLTKEGISLALKTDPESISRREEIQTIIRQVTDRINSELNLLAKKSFSAVPEFNGTQFDNTNTSYIFYQPVLYRQGAEQSFVRGIVLVNVSTKMLIDQLISARNTIIITTSLFAFVSFLLGVIISLFIASIIIIPIKKLANHVALIRDTEDKEKLSGHYIDVRTKDEIGLLGEIVNDMTQGLIRAAAAAKDLTVGKEVQKMFIPLEMDSDGKKLTTGKLFSKQSEFFGYYEGAKGVSGDYFDFKQLDDRHYAVIKCDVAGKGVPASLIMVEVATLFLDYFKDWRLKTHGYNLSPFVSRVNDMLESRGFKGRFAAFSLCIFDSFSGDTHFCNAGDNMLHFYNAATGKKIVEHIPETPAAGVFPSYLVDSLGGFKVITRRLARNDTLFMYTDGIEEAKRMFRNEKYENILCQEPGLEPNTPHESHVVGEESEELGADRVNAIIEAVFARAEYRLVKWHNPIKNELFEFDFSACAGTVEDCIIALVSVEKIFRMYKTPSVNEYDRVLVDRKIDTFLKENFKQYNEYCGHKKNHTEMPEYLWYTHVLEDPQYDDLTLLGIRKI